MDRNRLGHRLDDRPYQKLAVLSLDLLQSSLVYIVQCKPDAALV